MFKAMSSQSFRPYVATAFAGPGRRRNGTTSPEGGSVKGSTPPTSSLENQPATSGRLSDELAHECPVGGALSPWASWSTRAATPLPPRWSSKWFVRDSQKPILVVSKALPDVAESTFQTCPRRRRREVPGSLSDGRSGKKAMSVMGDDNGGDPETQLSGVCAQYGESGGA